MNRSNLRKFIAAILLLPATNALAVCDPETGIGCGFNPAPAVTLTAPGVGSTSSAPGSFTLSATANDNSEVESVEFFSNNVSVGIDGTAPYSMLLSGLAVGSYQIKAKATDDQGKSATTAPITVTVSASSNAPPTISLTSPASGAWAVTPGSFVISASAGDTDGSIANVKFKSGASILNTDSTYPYSFSWTGVATGSYTLTAVATDNAGATTTSVPVSVTVSSSAPNQPPTVSLTSPGNGTSGPVGTALSLAAFASDTDGSITGVKFLANGALLCNDISSPYACTYSSLSAGSYAITAIATDSGGATTTSIASMVTVNAAGVVSETRFYVYDSGKRLCKTINPESAATIIQYDAAGNVLWSADGQNLLSTVDCQRDAVDVQQRSTRTYDLRNRVVKVETPGHTADVTTEYYLDGAVKKITAANAGGHDVVTTYSYNKRRLLTGEVQTNGVTQYPLDYIYNPNGHLAELIYPDGESVVYTLDGLGRATQVAGSGQTYASVIKYFPGGAIKSFTYGSGATHEMTQNERRLPARSLDKKGSTILLDDEYLYDAHGNVTDIKDQRGSGISTTRGMAYDGRDRLTAAVGPWGTATYAYDALDNLRSADQGTRQYRYTYDTNWRLSTIKSPAGASLISFGYDSGGNLIAKNNQTFAFDIANRMSSAAVLSGIGSQVYRYDGLGRRVQSTDPDGNSDPLDNPSSYWIYSQAGQVLYSTEARRSRNIAYIYLGNTQIATRTVAWAPLNTAPTVRYQHTDALGSPVVDTDSTASTASINRTSYAPYGEPLSPATVDGTGYTGHVMDADTGLTYMQQRYYDPAIGRFLSVDPVAARETGDNFNRYWYANNNPYKFTDPDGRESGMFQQEQYRMAQPDAATGQAAVGLVADFTPVVGDIKAFAEAYQNPTLRNVSAAVVGLVPIIGDGAGKVIKNADRISTLKPGPFAKESIPGHMGKPTKSEQTQVNGLMAKNGCHTCGTKEPGTKSGNSVVDHQPARALGQTKEFLPHCIHCMRRQGGEVLQEKLKQK